MAEAENKTVTFCIDAFDCDDYGDGPSYAKFEIDQAAIDRLKHLGQLIEQNNLTMVGICDGPTWGPGDVQGELRLNSPDMSVTRTSFWYSDIPKHSNLRIETRIIEVSDLEQAFERAAHGELVFLGSNPKELEELVEEHDEGANPTSTEVM